MFCIGLRMAATHNYQLSASAGVVQTSGKTLKAAAYYWFPSVYSSEQNIGSAQ